jgi:hypothetical protein
LNVCLVDERCLDAQQASESEEARSEGKEPTMRVSPRGRAILHRLAGASAYGRSFRPGDFILTHSKGTLAWALGLATGGELNQAALIVDASGGLIEVNPFFITPSGGLRRSHIHEYLDKKAPVWVGYVEVVDGTRAEVVRFAEQMLEEQEHFSEWQFAGLLLHIGMSITPRHLTARYGVLRPLHGLFDRHALIFKEENIFTSAELVARALERGGFLWEKDPASITPADLFERFYPAQAKEVGRPARLHIQPAACPAVLKTGDLQQVSGAEFSEVLAPQSAEATTEKNEAGTADAPILAFPGLARRQPHAQVQMALRVGGLLAGGLAVALGLGWAARALDTRQK